MVSRPRLLRRASRRAHGLVVARRLELLGAELAAARATPSDDVTHTRVRPRDLPPSPPAPRTVAAPPGRHADRSGLAFGLAHLAVVAVLVVLGLATAAWWLASGDPPAPAASPLPTRASDLTSLPVEPAGDDSASGSTARSRATTPPGTVTVDVAGKVRRPGIAVLDAGARVVDALEAAGGASAGVDLTDLNLARVLVDGEQILVGLDGTGAAVGGVVSGATGSASPVSQLVNINTADQVALEALPEVGPVTAQSIVTWRAEHGAFTSVDQLLDVDGIGEATLAELAPYVTL